MTDQDKLYKFRNLNFRPGHSDIQLYDSTILEREEELEMNIRQSSPIRGSMLYSQYFNKNIQAPATARSFTLPDVLLQVGIIYLFYWFFARIVSNLE